MEFQRILSPRLSVSNKGITAIQRDSHQPGMLLIATEKQVYQCNVTAKLSHVFTFLRPIYGDGARAGYGRNANFSGIVDIVQPSAHELYILQRNCIRKVNRNTDMVTTVVGNCTFPGFVNGDFAVAKFTNIISGVLLSRTALLIAEQPPNSVLRLLNLIGRSVVETGAVENVTTIFLNPMATLVLSFGHGLYETTLVTGLHRRLSRYGRYHTFDGSLSRSMFRNISDAFYIDSDTALAVDSEHNVFRIVDFKSQKVSSICSVYVHGVVGSQMDSVSLCRLGHIHAAAILPEQGLIVLGIDNALQTAVLEVKPQVCTATADCELFCKRGKVIECNSNAKPVCDPTLNQCSFKCGSFYGYECAHGHHCHTLNSSIALCRRYCNASTDCFFGQICNYGFCSDNSATYSSAGPEKTGTTTPPPVIEPPPLFCYSRSACLSLGSVKEESFQLVEPACSLSNSSLLTIYNESHGRYLIDLIVSTLPISTMSKLWIHVDNGLLETNGGGPEYELLKIVRQVDPSSNSYYDLTKSRWLGTNDEAVKAVPICYSKLQQVKKSTCVMGCNCIRGDYLGCHHTDECLDEVDPVDIDDCECDLSHLLEYGILIDNIAEIFHLNFTGKRDKF